LKSTAPVHPKLKILLHCTTNFLPATTENIYLAAIYTKDLTLMVQIHVLSSGLWHHTTWQHSREVRMHST